MTVAITAPLSGNPLGPGFVVQASSDFVGPLEPDSFWRITLTAPANEDVVLVMSVPTDVTTLSTTVVDGSIENPVIVPGRFRQRSGESGQLKLELVEPTGGTVDTQTVAIIMDRQTGQNAEMAIWLAAHTAAAGEGLTLEEHAAVLQTNVGVIALAGLNPLEMIGDLANALRVNPPLAFGSLSTFYELTGDGEMPDVADLFHTKLGIYFVATIPAGLSHRHGQSEEYPSRLIQWRTVHRVGGLEMVTEVVDFQTHGELWKWSTAKPLRIEYSVLPSVVVQAAWWQFP